MPSSSRIDIRLTEEEKQAIAVKAKNCGLSISDYIRFIALNAKIDVRIEKASGK